MLKIIISIGFMIWVYSFPSSASIDISDNLTLSGFGSTSIAKATSESPLFVNREITDDTCFDCDTTLGLQLDYTLTDEINASMQAVKRPKDEWSELELEWLYLSYSTNSIEAKIGRLRLPLFLTSEYYYVSQAYVWARPPQEVYGSVLGITSFDGISVAWNHYLSDELLLTISPYYGGYKEIGVEMGSSDFEFVTNSLMGLSIDIIGFNYRIHSNVLTSNYDQEIFVDGMRVSNLKDQDLLIYSLGSEYSYNEFQFMVEAQTSDIQSSWYTSISYTFDLLTPYIVYSESYDWKENYSITSGLRYDITSKISINTEWQRMKLKGNSVSNSGQFTDNRGDNESSLVTFIVNFIF
ncbi:hypothetical protein PVK62_01120 [Aliivibrio sp. S3MY1]|uniref:hypothetical protein n=1 Tax=unclassified Aliivibrio TaxID=2645654 RepID=UPI0023796081|nr:MULTISPECIES: hypothetical protein [unclassified Aliivibrio]MDD9194432.1 hypothetical protein [Aliivibrio sp. S3MY1]MDD9198229.1 hypothetical protein [Aliivibrio sp. S2MY1]